MNPSGQSNKTNIGIRFRMETPAYFSAQEIDGGQET